MSQQIDADKLKKAEASVTIAKSMITQAIEQSAANPTMAEEALKQAGMEMTQAQTLITQAQTPAAAQSAQQTK